VKIQNLVISNFRGINRIEARDLGDTIIVAGQNGSGKSCIFDAIRLLKSTYGGYQQNEWQQFFGEFQIQLGGGAQNLKGLFNDPGKSCDIECHFQLRDRERQYRDAVLADLVGDLAAFRPGGKGLIFEGGGDTDFDRTFVGALFQEELRGVNLISGSNKVRVKALHDVLERAYSKGDLPTKFFAVVDKDTDGDKSSSGAVSRYEWGVYHVENYLLQTEIITHVLDSISLGKKHEISEVEKRLRSAAANAVPRVAAHLMRDYVNRKLVGAIDLGLAPKATVIAAPLSDAASRSVLRMHDMLQADLSSSALQEVESEFRNELDESLDLGTWKELLPGREILRQFVQSEGLTINYEVFRNLLVGRMIEIGFKPSGMREIINKVCEQ